MSYLMLFAGVPAKRMTSAKVAYARLMHIVTTDRIKLDRRIQIGNSIHWYFSRQQDYSR